jgi:hypothetical protein
MRANQRQRCLIRRLGALAINSILDARFATSLFHQPEARILDDQSLKEWTAVLTAPHSIPLRT